MTIGRESSGVVVQSIQTPELVCYQRWDQTTIRTLMVMVFFTLFGAAASPSLFFLLHEIAAPALHEEALRVPGGNQGQFFKFFNSFEL
eukprot:7872357-Pyramimonas_sp.AAC.1